MPTQLPSSNYSFFLTWLRVKKINCTFAEVFKKMSESIVFFSEKCKNE